MSSPEVSVVIPVFNRESLIGESLGSLRPRIVLLEGEHRGTSAARNIGLRAASGAYITFLECPPGRIGRQLSKLLSAPGTMAVVGETLWFEVLTPDFERAPGTRYSRAICTHVHSSLFARAVFDTSTDHVETGDHSLVGRT